MICEFDKETKMKIERMDDVRNKIAELEETIASARAAGIECHAVVLKVRSGIIVETNNVPMRFFISIDLALANEGK